MFGLADLIRRGLVRVLGAELKGGLELLMGKALFHKIAVNPIQAVELLEEAVVAMNERARMLAGLTRQHQATCEDPFVLILIDELAAITAYLTDRKLRLRADTAVKLLCS